MVSDTAAGLGRLWNDSGAAVEGSAASPLPRRHAHAYADEDASYRQADSGTWHRTREDTPRDNGGHADATIPVPWPRPIIATGKPTGLPHASTNRGNPHRWRFRGLSREPGSARSASFARVGASHRRPMLKQRRGNSPQFLTVHADERTSGSQRSRARLQADDAGQ